MFPVQSAGPVEYTDCISAERYDTKQLDGDALETQSTLSLPSLPGPLWFRVVAPDRVLSMEKKTV